MEFIMDMVHDNPGEIRTKTIFRKPETLTRFGYNTQVFKHLNTIATFSELGEDFFPSKESKEWLSCMTQTVVNEIQDAKKEGLMAMSHIDLFVLPKALVERYKDKICDIDGRISIYKEKTKELHRIMFDELFSKYSVDGIIVRVGETYLFDTPYHTGNGAVKYGDKEEEKDTFVELINFLVEEICNKHGKYLIFRTWDCFADRFHADLEYYLDVTNRITPCDKLIFSIKHTALDFWRRVKFNPCLGQGNHRQVVEVQCQREYEGKGAYPSYIMDGVINGFSEIKNKIGLKALRNNPLICGVYTWSRGGGWFGPYIKNEFWCELNAYVISQYAKNPDLDEKVIFDTYIKKRLGTDMEGADKFYMLCKKASDALLHGRYIEVYDKTLNEEYMPCCNWMRDDRIGGLRHLEKVFDYLEENGLTDEALSEKEQSVSEWAEVKKIFESIQVSDDDLKEFISNSIEYGKRLFEVVNIAFKIFASYRKGRICSDLIEEYDEAWKNYIKVEELQQASSSYSDTYSYGETDVGQGMRETVDMYRKFIRKDI